MISNKNNVITVTFVCDDNRCDIMQKIKVFGAVEMFHHIGNMAIYVIENEINTDDISKYIGDTINREYAKFCLRTKPVYDFIHATSSDDVKYTEIGVDELYTNVKPKNIEITNIVVTVNKLPDGKYTVDSIELIVRPFLDIVSEYNADCFKSHKPGYTIPIYNTKTIDGCICTYIDTENN